MENNTTVKEKRSIGQWWRDHKPTKRRIIQLYASDTMTGSWYYDGTGYRYLYSDGSFQPAGWFLSPENGAWYYLDENGYAVNGWLYLDDGTFYLDPSSNAMLTGHLYIDGVWYYFNSDGYLCDGEWEYDGTGYKFRFIDGTYAANCWVDDSRNNYVRYYIGSDGYAVSGWNQVDGTWYYFDPGSRALLNDWLCIDDNWYYTDATGAMQTGWIELDGNMYYLDPTTGIRATGTQTINGATCTFDENGVLTDGTIIEDTETPTVGGGYDSYAGGMPADGTGVVQAHGIDISKWNNGDDWTTLKLNLEAVKAAGIDFVIMRCGSTNKGEDPMFDMYYEECKRLGLDVGVYFYTYALDAETALSDAKKCVSYIEGKQLEYPVYLDFEDPTHETIGGTLSATICKTFMDEVASHNYLTGLYSYKSWLELDWVTASGLRDKYEAWAAYPVLSKDHAKYDVEMSQKFGMYQYTFEYEIANAGTFDANVCYKDYPTIVKTYGFNNYSASGNTNMSASWVQDDYGLKYMYSDGTYAGAGWLWDADNSAWYYLDENGYAVSGWVEDNGNTYYLDPNTNAMLTGHRYIDGNWYYFDSSGALVTTGMWVQDDNGFKYQMGDGTFVYSGWIDDPTSGARYYLDANGYAVNGFQTIDGTLYYFDPSSNALLRGWINVDGALYCTAADGAILKGFRYVDGEYYYFDETTGAMQTGFVTFGSKWYYFDTADGTMMTGWFTSPKTGYIYYFNNEGEMTTGWAEIDGYWYFFEDNMENHYGQMLTGWITSSTSGYTYYVGEDGRMVTGWQTLDGNTYYFDPADEAYVGRMVTGIHNIDDIDYVFDENGVLVGQLATPEAETFTVIYLNADGSYLGFEEVESGNPAVNIPENPTMNSDAQYTYTFTGWDKDLTSITEDTVVTAQYTAQINSCTVTFVDYNGSVISEQTVEYGGSAASPENPYRAADTEYVYTFTGWDTDFSTVTSDLTVTAVYEQTEQVYYLRGGFNSWQTTDVMTKGENSTYTAVFTLDAGTYEYKAANADYSMEWPLGTNQSITLGEKSIVTFTLDTVNHTLTAHAVSAVPKYTVVFMDFDGTALSTQYITAGESATAPESPARQGYTFTGWSNSFENITADTTLIAQYEKEDVTVNKYIVNFVDNEGKLISSQLVEEGASATAPESPSKSGYTFTGWDTDFNNVTENLTVTAQFEKNPSTVTPITTGLLKVDVTGGTGFTLTMNDVTRPQGTSYMNTKAPIGASVTLVANTVEGVEFVGWVASNGAILSTSETYSFTTSGNDYVKAMYKTDVDGVCLVVFKNDKAGSNGQILDMQYYAAADEVVFPADPTQVGFNFTGWNMTEDEIKAQLAAGNAVTVLAAWERRIIKVQVSVTNGTGAGEYNANSAVTVVANEAETGYKFAYWVDAKGTIKSYNAAYKFYPTADTALTAVFVSEDTEVEQKVLLSVETIDTAGTTDVFYFSWYVPEEYTVVRAGIIAVKSDNYNEDTFYAGSTDSNVYTRPNMALTDQSGTSSWTKSNVASGDTWYAKAFVTYTYVDENGVTQTVTAYSDLAEATK